MSSILQDLYVKQIAQSRLKPSLSGNARRGALSKNLKEGDEEGENEYVNSLMNKTGRRLVDYISDMYGGGSGIASNASNAGMGNYQPSSEYGFNFSPDFSSNQYGGDFMSDYGTGVGGSSTGGEGGTSAMNVMAIIEAALAVRGQGADKYGEEIPWGEKTQQQRTTSAPVTAGAMLPMYLAGNIASGGDPDSSNEVAKGLNKMQEYEYKFMTPLYNMFIKGPKQGASAISSNKFYGWGD
jgi:hypothetical protein